MDYNKLAAVEHEMRKKFGEDVVKHPRADWSEEDQERYTEETTEMHKKFEKLTTEKAYSNKKGYLVSKKLLNDSDVVKKNCPYCDKYHFLFNVADDLNMNKYGCCMECYYRHIEGRESRWENGWRPEKDNKRSIGSGSP